MAGAAEPASRARRAAPAAAAVLLGLLAGAPAGSDEPLTSNIRYNREVVRILQRRCLACHGRGGLAEPLTSYHEVRPWGRAIREELIEQRMPPWSAARGYGRFRNDLALTDREAAALLLWLDGGMRRGEPADLAAFEKERQAEAEAAAAAPEPDRRVPLPPQTIPALEDLVVRRVVVESGLAEDAWLRSISVTPGERSVLRGALVFAAAGAAAGGSGTGRWLGAWLPWQAAATPPDGRAFRLPARSRLLVLLYYRGAEQERVDRSSLELRLQRSGRPSPVHEAVVETAPSGAGRHAGELVLAEDSTVWALQPDPGGAATLELRAARPDGSSEVLLWVPAVRPEWPQALILERPVRLPAGSRVTLAARAGPGGGPAPRLALSLLR